MIIVIFGQFNHSFLLAYLPCQALVYWDKTFLDKILPVTKPKTYVSSIQFSIKLNIQ